LDNLLKLPKSYFSGFFADVDKNCVKGTVSVISIDPQSKDSKVQFTAVPLKALSIKYELDIYVYNFKN